MSGRRGSSGTGVGADLQRAREQVRKIGGSFGAQNIVGSRLRPRAAKAPRLSPESFVKKPRKARVASVDIKPPKPLVIRKNMSPEEVKRVAQKNKERLEKFKDRVQKAQRIEVAKEVKQAEKEKKATDRLYKKEARLNKLKNDLSDELTRVEKEIRDDSERAVQSIALGESCRAIGTVRRLCSMDKKYQRTFKKYEQVGKTRPRKTTSLRRKRRILQD
jgi:hypothetical protein